MAQTSYELKSSIDKLIVQIHGINKTWVEIHLAIDTLFNLLEAYGSHFSHELRFLLLRRMHLHYYCAFKSMNFVPFYLQCWDYNFCYYSISIPSLLERGRGLHLSNLLSPLPEYGLCQVGLK